MEETDMTKQVQHVLHQSTQSPHFKMEFIIIDGKWKGPNCLNGAFRQSSLIRELHDITDEWKLSGNLLFT